MMKKYKILLFASYYAPSYKAGGPIKTILNLVDSLSDDFEFWIVTRDRDLGDEEQFFDIRPNEWHRVGLSNVMYVSAANLDFRFLAKLIKDDSFDLLYLNSFFDFHFSIKVLYALKLKLFPRIPVVLAPRGEFSEGALNIKSFKKKFFMFFSGFLGLHSNISWQASTDFEKADIIHRNRVDDGSVYLAKDLPESLSDHEFSWDDSCSSSLRVVFLSRISPMKNLDYALMVLSKVKRNVSFDIYGPKEDSQYWVKCKRIMDNLPSNIQARYIDAVRPSIVGSTFSKYDLFLFPTRGENYGHVIAESLAAGTPVLLSDNTSWKGLLEDGLGWELPLDDQDSFVEIIEAFPMRSAEDRLSHRKMVRAGAVKRIKNPQDITDNKEMFYSAMRKLG